MGPASQEPTREGRRIRAGWWLRGSQITAEAMPPLRVTAEGHCRSPWLAHSCGLSLGESSDSVRAELCCPVGREQHLREALLTSQKITVCETCTCRIYYLMCLHVREQDQNDLKGDSPLIYVSVCKLFRVIFLTKKK